jgi:ankyrin repeat protein
MTEKSMRQILTLTLLSALILVSALALAAPADSPVADAAMRGDIKTVRALLQQGADVNAARPDGMTALHWAAEKNDAELADMILYAGGNPKAVTRIGAYTPLHVASRQGSIAVVEKLLKAGADVNVRTTNSGVSALHLAAASGNAPLVNLLLDNGAQINAWENESGQTALIFAAASNRVEAVKTLLKRGADPRIAARVVDIPSDGRFAAAARARQTQVLQSFGVKENETPSAAAVQAAVLAARELYLSKEIPPPARGGAGGDDAGGRGGRGGRGGGGGQQGQGDDGRLPPLSAKGGLTPLHHAARQGHIETVVALLDGKADINQLTGGDQTSPLLMAIINAQFDVAMKLIERGADTNLAAGNSGIAPLWATVNAEWQPRTRFPQPQEHGLQKATYLDVMEALLKAGAKPDTRTNVHPWYMVYTGCGNGNCGLEDTQGSTAFWRAAYATDVAAMKLLVKYGADPNIPTKSAGPRQGFGGGGGPEVPEPDAPTPLQPVAPGLWPATAIRGLGPDPSGLPQVPAGGPAVYPIQAAAGVGYGEGFAGNAHRHAPDAWLAAVKYLVEELKADVNSRDADGYTALHHAAARGDNELILWLVSKGADVTVVSRRGQTVADMANGPVSRVSPFPETVALLEKLGSKNSHKCITC